MSVELLFKFRSVTTIKQLSRIIDSIDNNRIYLPNYKQLNDPLESSGYIIEISGYAGQSIMRNTDEEDIGIRQFRNKFKILSLSESCFSPSMWAHYAQEYRGICIGYWKQREFASARKIEYLSSARLALSTNLEYNIVPDDKVEEETYESFFYKHNDWKSEKEWRIVKNTTDDFLVYDRSMLACIIIGEGVDDNITQLLRDKYEQEFPMYRTKTGYRTFGINLLPIDYEIEYDGSEPPYIKTIEDLIKQL